MKVCDSICQVAMAEFREIARGHDNQGAAVRGTAEAERAHPVRVAVLREYRRGRASGSRYRSSRERSFGKGATRRRSLRGTSCTS